MSPTHRVWLLLLCGLMLFTNTGLPAGRKTRREPTPVRTHHETIISQVTANSVTVTAQTLTEKGTVVDKAVKAYTISPFTEVRINGQRASIGSLKPGMKVTVTLGTDPTKLARIVANG